MPGDIPPKGGAEKMKQIMFKMKNIDKEVCRELIVAFADTVNIESTAIFPEELWNWVKNVCQHCLYNSSEGLCTHQECSIEVTEAHVQTTNEEKLKWIQDFHDSPVAGHPGQAKSMIC
jgi:hypothetical protein